MKIHLQNMTKSNCYALLSKKKSYGYYCNLCIKYDFPRLHRKYFKPSMILSVERQYLHKLRLQRTLEYNRALDAFN